MTLQARNDLVETNLGFVRTLARLVAARLPPSIEVDDLTQQGYLGLMQAAERYDPARNTSFPAFARRRVVGAMLDYCRRRHWKEAVHVSIDTGDVRINDSKTRQMEWKSAHPLKVHEPDERIIRREEAREVHRAMRLSLSDRELYVISHYYGAEQTHDEIGAVVGVGGNRVGQIHRQALRELRGRLGHLRRAA